MAVHLAVACDVFMDVSLCCPFTPRDVLDKIWDLIGSVSEGFPTYFSIAQSLTSSSTRRPDIIEILLKRT